MKQDTDVSTSSVRYMKKRFLCLFTMGKNRNSNNSGSQLKEPHTCGLSCLGPLTFDTHVGSEVHLSQGGHCAERRKDTFKNGVVFSSRPVKVQERIRLQVGKVVGGWHGALRVGFTTVPPTGRSLPLPCMAIPNLTDTPGHWAAPVDESLCQQGSELQFWVSYGGSIYVSVNGTKRQLLTGVDLSRQLWAMVDVYGQTYSVLLLGSEKRNGFRVRKSCSALPHLSNPDSDKPKGFFPDVPGGESCKWFDTKTPSVRDGKMECVVCMGKEAMITLRPCGHQCLCTLCAYRVLEDFGTCPLCRQNIRSL
ncbi:E3 ubiquitin-protein ligase NEURL3 isoform X2 [Sphaeramia orbicularis]|uniref:E3 ubiquitin-protein ligase NEURL3 isoform X2 n=1 Tax=Sphaeramia orbicularis TaxID=375764 RepID=UPI001180D51D|nr:E3 ubiquitin-protein ligase NEURL3-like isoform X2 [Sphaeramia orbicularis]